MISNDGTVMCALGGNRTLGAEAILVSSTQKFPLMVAEILNRLEIHGNQSA